MFTIKKIIGALLGPLIIGFFLLIVAAVMRASGRRRVSLWIAALAGLIAYAGSTPWVGATLLGALERQHPALIAPPAVANIVVLGSDYSPGAGIAITGALDPDGLARIVEGVRINKRIGSARLIVSGGAPHGRARSSHGYAKLAIELGIPASNIVVLDTPLDTASEAREVANLLEATPFILVTSAYHMPRALRLMEAQGTSPIPAPAGQRVRGGAGRSLLPSSGGLRMTELALHEYAGLLLIAVSSRGSALTQNE